MNIIEERLNVLGIKLPDAPKSVASYVPFVKTGSLIYVAGQLPLKNGMIEPQVLGRFGEIDVSCWKDILRLCVINLVSQLKHACDGDLIKVIRCVQLCIYINAKSDFTDHSDVADIASGLIIDIFGASTGRHSRSTVGVNSLPKGVAAEISGVFEIKNDA